MLNLISSVDKQEVQGLFSFVPTDQASSVKNQDGFLNQLSSLLKQEDASESELELVEGFDFESLALVLGDAELSLDEEQDFLPQISSWLVEQGLAADLSPIKRFASVEEKEVSFEDLDDLEFGVMLEKDFALEEVVDDSAEELSQEIKDNFSLSTSSDDIAEVIVQEVKSDIELVDAKESSDTGLEISADTKNLSSLVTEDLIEDKLDEEPSEDSAEEVLLSDSIIVDKEVKDTDPSPEVGGSNLASGSDEEVELEKTEQDFLDDAVVIASSVAHASDDRRAEVPGSIGVTNSSISTSGGSVQSQQSFAGVAAGSDNSSNANNSSEQQRQLFTQQELMQGQQKVNQDLQQMVKEALVFSDQLKASNDSVAAPAEGASENKRSSAPNLASINYPLRHPNWPGAIGKRLTFMVNNQLQQAQITLNPEKLGPVKIRLQVDKDGGVSVAMTAQHGMTRDALEQAIPRLRDMLSESGIKFSDLNVQDEAEFNQSQDQQSKNKQQAGSLAEGEELAEQEKIIETDNLIDYYA